MLNRLKLLLVVVSAIGLSAGFLAPYFGMSALQHMFWGLAATIVLLFLAREILTSLWRGEFGLDIVAALSMSGALYFGETLAAAVVSLMYSGGQLLENFAEARARAEMNTLLGRAPTKALRYLDGQLIEVRIEELVPGDRILVRQGEIVPVDGKVASGKALLDQSILTGESVPVYRNAGDEVLSGSSSLDTAFDVITIRPASQSTYSGIVRLVQAAQEAKAPMVRLADRFALWFLALTVLLAGGTWIATGDHLRMLAVLVSATPCPLILAVPVAIISGISKSARRGVLVKGGPVLETLARASVLVIDKTGTLTEGRAKLVDIHASGRHKSNEILRLAASLDQASQHVIAASIVEAAIGRGLALSMPVHAKETWLVRASKGMSAASGSSSVAVILCAGSSNSAPCESLPPRPGQSSWRWLSMVISPVILFWRTRFATMRRKLWRNCGRRASRESYWPLATSKPWSRPSPPSLTLITSGQSCCHARRWTW